MSYIMPGEKGVGQGKCLFYAHSMRNGRANCYNFGILKGVATKLKFWQKLQQKDF